MMALVLAPSPRAAVTKSRLRSLSDSPRTSRAMSTQPVRPRITITL